MIPVGQPYQPAGHFDVRATLTTLILGSAMAVVAAALIWLWEISPIPQIVILTSVIQGVIVGVAMGFMVGRLRMRAPMLAAVIGFACGSLSVFLVHYAHYVQSVYEVRDAVLQDIRDDQDSTPDQKKRALDLFGAMDPFVLTDKIVIFPGTQKHGFLGAMILRNRAGLTIRGHTKATGAFLWLLWAAEGVFVAGTAAAMARSRAAAPYCEDCGAWCIKQGDLFALPGSSSEALAAAVREGRPDQLAALRANPPEVDGPGHVVLTLHACPSCDQSFADVKHRISNGKEVKETSLVKELRVSPELAATCRAEFTKPAPASAAEPSPGPESPGAGPAGEVS
jgi:hypothetical protein